MTQTNRGFSRCRDVFSSWTHCPHIRLVYTEPFLDLPYPTQLMDLVLLMARHGYALTFSLLLAEAIGLPFPAAIALVAAGAAVAAHALWGPYVMVVVVSALLLGDTVQFWLG